MQQYHPAEVRTHFAYPVEGSFADAAMRCVGVGKCRKTDGGAMCPTYMATGDEQHSTRGRARLLFEMLQGEVVTDGFRSEAVKEALDLCLVVQGLQERVPGRRRHGGLQGGVPRALLRGPPPAPASYAFGLINHWGAMAEYAPRLANFFIAAPPFSTIVKWALDVAPERRLPAFAPRSFRRGFLAPRARAERASTAPSPESRVPSPESRGCCCGPTPPTTTSTPRSRTPP